MVNRSQVVGLLILLTAMVNITGIFPKAPLVLIDGVVAGIEDIDPNNIESMSVLKDAVSASIYGSRAAGGVIIITSKRRKSGLMKVDYNRFYG